jgi:hypothetical protein
VESIKTDLATARASLGVLEDEVIAMREDIAYLKDRQAEMVETIAQRVIEHFYSEVGKSAVKRIVQLIGLIAVAAGLWLMGSKAQKFFS